MKESPSPLPPNEMEHLDEMTCLLYLERQLDRARGLQVSEHVQQCATCRTLMRALERESRLLTRAMLEEEEPLPARLAHFRERARKSLSWIWGAAFALSATGVYALYTTYLLPWQKELDNAGFGGTNLLSLLIFQSTLWKGWQSMLTLLEGLALVTLAIFGFVLFRRRMRRGSALAVVLAGMCAAMLLPAPAAAREARGAALLATQAENEAAKQTADQVSKKAVKHAVNRVVNQVTQQTVSQVVSQATPPAGGNEFRHADRITIGSDEVIHGDLYAAGGRVRVEGTIEGDLIVASGDVEIVGHILGDVLSASGAIRVTGKVDGNVRGHTGNFTLRGTVGRNVTVSCGELNIDHDGSIGGSLTAFCGHTSIDGHIGRDVLAFTGHTDVNGSVGGSMRIAGGELAIDSTAQVGGPIHFKGDRPPEVSPQAKLASPVQYEHWKHGPDYSSVHYYIWQVIWMAAYILFGMVLFLLLPQFSKEAVANTERYGPAFGLGVLVFFGLPIAALIACVTVVGLFIGISALFLWYACLYYGATVVGALVGQWILGRTRELWPLIGRMALGAVIVRIVTLTPEVGGWVKWGVALWGLGAISLAVYRRFEPAVAPGAPSGPYVSPLPPATTVGGVQPA